MATIKIYEFGPVQATDLSNTGTEHTDYDANDTSTKGIKERLDTLLNNEDVDAMTTYMIGGNLYVVVAIHDTT